MNWKHFLIAALPLMLAQHLTAQTVVVHGKLTVFNKYPVQNVLVEAKKAKSRVQTDSLGRFTLVCMENDVIRIRPKVFKPVTRKVRSTRDTMVINLVFIDTQKNRELAVGYGYMDKEDLIFAVNNLQQENNEFCNYTDVFDIIQGRFPGVRVSNGQVFIRGQNSINSDTEALFVVDGVPTGSIGWIHPCDIKSINILKDSGAAIYGVRGSNGVVLIETKKGNQ